MTLINCKVSLMLTWSINCIISVNAAANQARTFAINDANLYVLVVTLPTQDDTKSVLQIKSGFKRTNSWNKYHSKTEKQTHNLYVSYLNHPSFQRVYFQEHICVIIWK